MRGVISWAVAGGATSSANTSSTPVICAVSATASPSSSRNAVARSRVGTPRARATASSSEANSSGRPITASDAERGGGDDREGEHLSARDAEEAAEQQALVVGEHALVEAEEQEAARQPERLDGAGERRLVAAVRRVAGRPSADHERRCAPENAK